MEGQKGIVFAAFLKLIIPFVVVILGIIAFNLYHENMQLDARGDAGNAMALYLKANSDTQFVKTVDNPDEQAVVDHEGPTYLIRLYDSDEVLRGVENVNPFVLPMLKEDFEGKQPASHQVFSDREDHAWKHVNPELASEIASYNQRVEEEAASSGGETTAQALVAYKI